jgi:hypothetical protein
MSLAISQWSQNVRVLKEFSTDHLDVLKLVGTNLQLTEGRKGVCGGWVSICPSHMAMAKHFENLIKEVGQEVFSSLKNDNDHSHAYYEKVSLFEKQVRVIYERMCDLKDHFFLLGRVHRYRLCSSAAAELVKSVKQYKRSLEKPLKGSRSEKLLEYNKRLPLRSLNLHSRYGYDLRPYSDPCSSNRRAVPVQEISRIAKKALSFSQVSQRDLISWRIRQMPILLFIVVCSLVWKILQSVEVFPPPPGPLLGLYLQDTHPGGDHLRVAKACCCKLLERPTITDEAIQAFEELDSQLWEPSDLSYLFRRLSGIRLVADDFDAAALFMRQDEGADSTSVVEFLKIVKEVEQIPKDPIKVLDMQSLYDQWHEVFRSNKRDRWRAEQSCEDFLKSRSRLWRLPICSESFISFRGLEKVIQLAAKVPSGRKIDLNKHLLAVPQVEALLQQNGYSRLSEEKQTDQYVISYERSS